MFSNWGQLSFSSSSSLNMMIRADAPIYLSPAVSLPLTYSLNMAHSRSTWKAEAVTSCIRRQNLLDSVTKSFRDSGITAMASIITIRCGCAGKWIQADLRLSSNNVQLLWGDDDARIPDALETTRSQLAKKRSIPVSTFNSCRSIVQ